VCACVCVCVWELGVGSAELRVRSAKCEKCLNSASVCFGLV